MTVSGNIGPRGDGYDPGELMSPAEAAAYHRPQIAAPSEELEGRNRGMQLL